MTSVRNTSAMTAQNNDTANRLNTLTQMKNARPTQSRRDSGSLTRAM